MTRARGPLPSMASLVGAVVTVVLLVTLAVAWAVPPERLSMTGIQDGSDYDSLIQPLVLGLAGTPVDDRLETAPADIPGVLADLFVSAAVSHPAGRLSRPRAPPRA